MPVERPEAASATPAHGSFLHQLWTFAKTLFAGLVALVAAVSAIAAALYIVAPQLGPAQSAVVSCHDRVQHSWARRGGPLMLALAGVAGWGG